jgi:hypothetical protein
MTYIVIDNFLKDFENIRNHLYNTLNPITSQGPHRNMHFWCDIDKNNEFSNICDQILNKMKSYYDMSKCVGYEVWTHNQSWATNGLSHLDKDEHLMKTKGQNRFPICSSVLYIAADLEDGAGELFIELDNGKNDVITPKANRFIMFDAGINHRVGEFSSTDNRFGFNINSWSYKIKLP